MKRINEILLYLIIFIVSISSVSAKEKVAFYDCVDGDTIKVKIKGDIKTIRMLAVDTPETVHPKKGIEFYGKEASNYTCEQVKTAKNLQIEYDDNSDKTDKYGRILAWVWIDDNLLQDNLVKNGYAEVAYLYGKYKYTDLLKDHQNIAEAKKIGIWNEDKRKEFDSSNNLDNMTYDKTKKDNQEDLSIKEIIIFIIVTVILSIFAPTINKVKKNLNKILK